MHHSYCRPYELIISEERERISCEKAIKCSPLKTWSSHQKFGVLSVAINEHAILTGGNDGVIFVSDPISHEIICVYREHHEAVFHCSFILDGHTVLSGSRDCAAKIWEAKTGKTKFTFAHAAPVRSLASVNDWIISFTAAGTLTIWNVLNGQQIRQIQNAIVPASNVCSCPPFLVFGTWGSHLQICSLEEEDPESFLVFKRLAVGHSRAILALDFNKKENLLLTGSGDKTAICFDLTTFQKRTKLVGHSGPVSAVAFITDKRVLTGSLDKTCRIWNLSSPYQCEVVMNATQEVLSLAVWKTIALVGFHYNSSIYDVTCGDVHITTQIQKQKWISK